MEKLEAVKIFEEKGQLDLEYDDGADVLYLSLGKPQAALGIDIGEGIVVRYDEINQTVTGLTIIGLRHKLLNEISLKTT